jgi:hypothetical protein
MDQTLSNAYAQAMGTNPLHSRNRSRYQFLYDSYVGGEDYRLGGYLTRYQLETPGEYELRLQTTPLDNQCRSIIATYISFLFRQSPEREFGSMENEPTIEGFLEDADREGRDLDSVMKQASIWANVFGHAWLLLSKPNIGAVTLADELAQDIRPYINMLTPLVVTDWSWTRMVNGSYQLDYFKYIEDVNGDITIIKEWTLDEITTHVVDTKNEIITETIVEINGLGCIPAVILYAHTSNIRGIGLSTISDLADSQRMIYNLTSEVEQAVRLGSHPSLVKTAETDAGSGAGSIIHMPDNMDPALKPYVLEFSGQPIDSIYVSIKNIVDSIDKMANTGSIRATETREMSGVSREVEFQLLNARLSEQADNIELAEEQLWKLYAAYQGQTWDGEICYPASFSIRDTQNELTQLLNSYTAIQDPNIKTAIQNQIAELLDLDIEEDTAPPANAAEAMVEIQQEGMIDGCPLPMTDKAANIANHMVAVEEANLGPASVTRPGTFWMARADRLGITEQQSRSQTCSNCGFYVNTQGIKDCFTANQQAGNIPLATEVNPTWENVPNPAGYCVKYDITCTPTRTCDTWAPGGPIVD